MLKAYTECRPIWLLFKCLAMPLQTSRHSKGCLKGPWQWHLYVHIGYWSICGLQWAGGGGQPTWVPSHVLLKRLWWSGCSEGWDWAENLLRWALMNLLWDWISLWCSSFLFQLQFLWIQRKATTLWPFQRVDLRSARLDSQRKESPFQ